MRNRPGFTEEDENPQLIDNLTPGTSTQAAPVPMQPPPPTTATPPASLPPPPAAAAPATPPASAPKLPGMPSSMSIDELTPYLGSQRQKLSRFGPDEQLALQDQLNRRQNSFGNRATEGLKGFADAIMMGVARAGNPNWQGQYQQSEQQYAQDQRNALKDARAANIQEVESGMTLDRMDPHSPLSKQAQEAYAPLFAKLGYNPSAMGSMSAATIDNNLSLMAQFGGKEMEAMIKQYELKIERARLAAAAGKTSSEAELARQKMRTDAATELLKRSGNAKVLGIPIPFTSDVSGAEQEEALGVLSEQMKGGGQIVDVSSPEEAEALPVGTRFRLNGRTGTVK